MSRITGVSAKSHNYPLEEPFEISLGVQTEATNVLAAVQTETGIEGYGEGHLFHLLQAKHRSQRCQLSARWAT